MADPVDHMMLDESVLDSDDEDHQVQRSEAPSNPNPAPATRVIRRRARRACIKCHERFVACYLSLFKILMFHFAGKFDVTWSARGSLVQIAD